MVEAVTTFVRVAAYQAPKGLCLSTSVDSRVELSEPHRLYYVCRLRETFQRDTAEMAPC